MKYGLYILITWYRIEIESCHERCKAALNNLTAVSLSSSSPVQYCLLHILEWHLGPELCLCWLMVALGITLKKYYMRRLILQTGLATSLCTSDISYRFISTQNFEFTCKPELYRNIDYSCTCVKMLYHSRVYIDGLVQDHSKSSALAMELLQFSTKPSICLFAKCNTM